MDSEILLAEDTFFWMTILCAEIAHAALQLENAFLFFIQLNSISCQLLNTNNSSIPQLGDTAENVFNLGCLELA